MTTDPPDPPVPEAMLTEAGFEPVERRTETLFEVGAVRIEGITHRYEDNRSSEAARDATDGALDHPIRFFAVTRLVFQPSLPFGVSLSMFTSTLRREARSSFAAQLEDRGLGNVERGSSQKLRFDGSRVRVREFSAEDLLGEGDGRSFSLSFRLSVLTHRGTAIVVTAGFPASSVAEQFDLTDPQAMLTQSAAEYQATFETFLGGVYEELTA
ncbi:hypothetical protein [Halovenus halobia]|uniref:hypothetical protein n=1 Tax=Halovenus halobia TaxID=3396622 RepID=UPI003F56CD11